MREPFQHQQASCICTTPSLSITRSIYFSSKCFQHQYAFKPCYFSNQGLKTACTKLFPLFPSANQCLSWLSHVFPGYKPSCSCKPRSMHMILHGLFIVIFRIILLVYVLTACPQRTAFSRICCLIGFKLICEFTQCQAQALNPCQVIHHFSLNAIGRIMLLACQIKA